MTLRVAIYARVSTQRQAHTQTIDQQLERLRVYSVSQGWHLTDAHTFRDDAHSGASLNRPGLDRLRDAVRLGELDRVLVTEPDRLARNYIHQMLLLDEFERFGFPVEFLDRPMGNDPHDRLLLQIRGAVAEYERTLIADRLRRGRQVKYRAGVLLPWTKPPYAYRLSPDRPRDPTGVWIEESEAAVVREIFARYTDQSSSLCQLARYRQEQGVPTPSGKWIWSLCTLRAILRQPAYTGQVFAGRHLSRPPRIRRSATHAIGRPHESLVELPREAWILVATIPAIVSEEPFDMAQRRLAQNRSFAQRHNTKHPYLLRALVSCGVCQAACTGRYVQGGYGYYVCTGKAKAIHSRKDTKCPARFAPAAQLDDLVWRDLCEVLAHPDSITPALQRAARGQWLPQELQVRREQVRRARRQVGQQRERLTEAYLGGVIPLTEYQRRRHELEQRQLGLDQQEERLAGEVNRQADIAGMVRSIEAFCQRVQTGLASATFDQKRQLVELLIDRVLVADGDVEIRYVLPTSSGSESVRFCHLRTDYFRDPEPVGRGRCEGPAHQIIRDRSGLFAAGAAHHPPARHADQARSPHEASHSLPAAARLRDLRQLRVDPRSAIGPTAARVNLTNARRQRSVGYRTRGGRTFPPGVVAAARHAERPTQERDWEVGLLRLDEAKHRYRSGSLSLAKKAAAFFRRSRSIRSPRFSVRSRRSSSRSAVVSPSLRRPASRSAWRTQLRITWPEPPRSSASWSGLRPPSRTRRTASARNSGG
jgi:site-specific DNA recombinase